MSRKPGSGPRVYPADKARQGEIILRTRMRRFIFIAGLFMAVLATGLMRWAGWY